MKSTKSTQFKGLNVAFVITALDIGGAETQAYELLKAYRSKGVTVSVISLIEGGRIYERFKNEGFKIHSLKMKNYLYAPFALVNLINFCQEKKIEILHGNLFHAYMLCRMVKIIKPKIKVISSAHSIYEGGKIRELIYRMTNFFSDINTNVSPKACEYFITNKMSPRYKMHLIPNGISSNKFYRTNKHDSSEVYNWLSIGRLSKEKDYPTLIKAFYIVSKTANFRLTIVGDGAEKSNLEKQINDFNLDGKIKIVSSIDVVDFYNMADAYISSSLYEGFGITLVEAIFMELPIVTTAHEGGEFILKNYNRRLIANKSNASELACSILYLMNMEKKSRIGEVQEIRNQVVKEFSIEKISDKWLEIYNNLARN